MYIKSQGAIIILMPKHVIYKITSAFFSGKKWFLTYILFYLDYFTLFLYFTFHLYNYWYLFLFKYLFFNSAHPDPAYNGNKARRA